MSHKIIKKIGLTTQPLEELIKTGHTLDFRLAEPAWKNLKVGGLIEFIEDPTEERSVICKITALIYYQKFSDLIHDFNGGLITQDYAKSLLKSLYLWWTKEEEEKYGVLGIRVEVVEVKKNKLTEAKILANRIKGNTYSYTKIYNQSKLDEVVYKDGKWTAKDIVGHIAVWSLESIKCIEEGLKGKSYRTEYADGDLFNQEYVDKFKSKSKKSIYEMWLKTHEKFLKLVKKAEKSKFLDKIITFPWGATGTVSHLIADMMDHEDEHFGDVMAHFAQQRTK